MVADRRINREHNIPQVFYEELEPYLRSTSTGDMSVNGIKQLWRSAIAYGQMYPELDRAIAEWTFTASAEVPVVLERYDLRTN